MQSRQHMQAGAAIKTHLQTSSRGDKGGKRMVGRHNNNPGDEASVVSAQDMSEQGSTGGGRGVDQPGGVT